MTKKEIQAIANAIRRIANIEGADKETLRAIVDEIDEEITKLGVGERTRAGFSYNAAGLIFMYCPKSVIRNRDNKLTEAVPELLEALEDILTRPTDGAARIRARAAIAKAKGEA